MSSRLNITLPDKLSQALDEVADDSESSKSEIFRKALVLYLTMRKSAKEENLKVGLFNPETKELQTEFIGL